jgi:hypothetical protein
LEGSDTIYTFDGLSPKKASLKFAIKAGPFLAVNFGPSFLWSTESFSYDYYNGLLYNGVINLDLYVPSMSLGIDFVFRIFPLKINAGVICDFNVPFSYFEQNLTATTSPYQTVSEDGFSAGFKFAVGGHAGVEILAGPHVGFAFDLNIRPFNYTTDIEVSNYSSYYITTDYSYELTHEMELPILGLAGSINFYFGN